MESFYSIQGEGFHSGRPAYFIRLGGCDVGCHWCDVKESWDATVHPLKSLEELGEGMPKDESMVIITGGEPLMYDLAHLTEHIRSYKKQLHLETSGAYPLSGVWDWICVSPKKFKPVLPEVLVEADELKIVIYHKSDLEWAESFKSGIKSSCKLFLQPEWSKADSMIPLISEYIKSNPDWRVSLQIHKYMGVP